MANGIEIGSSPDVPTLFRYDYTDEVDAPELLGLWVPVDKQDEAESLLRKEGLDIEADMRKYPD